MKIRILAQRWYQLGFDVDYFDIGDTLDVVYEVGEGFHARRANSPESPLVFIRYSTQNKDWEIAK